MTFWCLTAPQLEPFLFLHVSFCNDGDKEKKSTVQVVDHKADVSWEVSCKCRYEQSFMCKKILLNTPEGRHLLLVWVVPLAIQLVLHLVSTCTNCKMAPVISRPPSYTTRKALYDEMFSQMSPLLW